MNDDLLKGIGGTILVLVLSVIMGPFLEEGNIGVVIIAICMLCGVVITCTGLIIKAINKNNQ